MLIENNLTQKLIKTHTPEQDGIVERVTNKTMRESLVPIILTDYEQAKQETSKIIDYYNKRRHSSLNYLTPVQYYRGEPDILLAVREAKVEKARILGKERNVEMKKGGVTAGIVS